MARKCHICVSIETNRVPSHCEDLQEYQIKMCYGEYGVGSYLNVSERRKNKGGAASPPTIAKAAPVSLLGSLFLRSAYLPSSRGSSPILIRPSVRPMVAGALSREMAGFRTRSASATSG